MLKLTNYWPSWRNLVWRCDLDNTSNVILPRGSVVSVVWARLTSNFRCDPVRDSSCRCLGIDVLDMELEDARALDAMCYVQALWKISTHLLHVFNTSGGLPGRSMIQRPLAFAASNNGWSARWPLKSTTPRAGLIWAMCVYTLIALNPAALIFWRISGQSDGTGRRYVWNSPEL